MLEVTRLVDAVQRFPGEAAATGTNLVLNWVAAMALVAIVVGVAVWNLRPAPEPDRVSRSAYVLPEGHTLRNLGRALIALSPDGPSFVYNTTDGLYPPRLDPLDARLILGTEAGSRNPFFSPDGQ